MARTGMVILAEDLARFEAGLDLLRCEANARFVLLLDRGGQRIASAGRLDGVDPTALASLAAGNVAATEGLAALVGEDGFSSLCHEGRGDSIYLTLVSGRVILLVVFAEQSSLGLVKLRVEQHGPELSGALGMVLDRDAGGADAATVERLQITDEDIDALFGQGA